MEFQDDAFVLSARLHGDTGAVVELLTEQYGRRAAYVNGGASRKMKPFLQAGTKVVADFRSRTSDQLGSARLEPMGEGPASLFDDPLALIGLNAAAAVAAGAFSRTAGAPYADKLLRLPPFMLGAQAGLDDGDVKDGLALTGHFLEQYVFHALNKPLPPARVWMMERLQDAGRL